MGVSKSWGGVPFGGSFDKVCMISSVYIVVLGATVCSCCSGDTSCRKANIKSI